MKFWPPETYHTLLCRPALPKDALDVMDFTRTIWEGEDYVPNVWREWLADPQGLLVVAEYGGAVVATGKLTFLGEGEWWMEGLRVDPDYQGRGIASRLHDYMMGEWYRLGGGILRLATSSQRIQVQRLCAKSGFHQAAEYQSHSAVVISEPVESFVRIQAAEIQKAYRLTSQYPVAELAFGLMDLGWRWGKPTYDRLAQAVMQGRAYWWKPNAVKARGLLVITVDVQGEQVYSNLQLLVCAWEHIEGMLHDYRHLAGDLGCEKAAWIAPFQPELLPVLQSAGFSADWEMQLLIFEKARE